MGGILLINFDDEFMAGFLLKIPALVTIGTAVETGHT